MNARDTQFAGFAKLLLAEMLTQTQWNGMDFNSDDTEEVEEYSAIIARRAYDFVCHVVGETTGMNDVSHVPDLTHWPDEVHDGSS